MMSWLNRWTDLPVGAKVACVLLGGGGVSSAAYLLIGDPRVFLFIGIGLALVAGIFIGYRWLLKKRQARKSKPFEDQIANSGGATPREVSDPSRRAQMDSLRKKFDEGLRVYRQRGKDLYSVPWYVVIGEPASGKSAAIRNSGVGFPPGLTGEMQGVGGTINMDWFFTNDAVILDTAGRLAFEEVETAKTSEWKEFLRLLRVARPRCPINGMLIFIPVDSLKNDTADELEEKARKISQQLDFVQQTLGVRFPLSVVISKADLLVGFSEFFEGISDPREQYQIFGWSNPKPLDETFRPREIADALGAIRERVIRRRALLLKEPAPQALVAERRIDEVDRLFLLPDEIERIAPRLQRYLEMFFAGGQWSAPPPFLRGVYFTSALREGEAVDLALAEAIGTEASDVQEDRAWESKRSFFLHDVFMQKIFLEKGLVTSAPSPGRAKRKRLAVLYGAVAAILLGAIGLTVYSGYRFWDDLKKPERDWQEVAENVVDEDGRARQGRIAVFTLGDRSDKPTYWGDKSIKEGWKYTRASLASELGKYIEKNPLRAQGLFAVFSKIRLLTDLSDAQQDAQRALLNVSVVKPLLDVTSQMLAEDTAGKGWTDEATGAYAEMLSIWTLSEGQRPREESAARGEDDGDGSEETGGMAAGSGTPIGGMWEYFFTSTDAEHASADTDFKAVRQALDQAYGGSGKKYWPPESVDIADEVVAAATARFLESWTVGRASPTAARLLGVVERLAGFKNAEGEILERDWFSDITTVSEYEKEKADWEAELARLGELADNLDAAIKESGIEPHENLAALQAKAEKEVSERVDAEFAIVLGSLPDEESVEEDSGQAAERATPQSVAQQIAAKQESLRQGLLGDLKAAVEGFDADLEHSLKIVNDRARYRWRLEAYQAAGKALQGAFEPGDEQSATLVSLDNVRTNIDTRHTESAEEYARRLKHGVGTDSVGESMRENATAVCQKVVDAGRKYWRYSTASALLAIFDDAGSDLDDLVAEGVDDERDIELAGFSVTVGRTEHELVSRESGDARYAAGSAGRVFGAWSWLDKITADEPDGADGILERSRLRRLVEANRAHMQKYASAYLGYWSDDFREHFKVSTSAAWTDSRDMFLGLRARTVNRWLEDMAEQREAALEMVPEGLLSAKDSGELRTVLDATAKAREWYQDDSFSAHFREVKKEWASLPRDDATEARRRMLSGSMASFAEDYLIHSSQDERTDSLGFWDSLTDHLLRTLAESASGEFTDVLESTGPVLRQQPFCRDAQTAAQVGSYAEVAASVGVILGSSGGGGSETFEPGTVGAGDGTTSIDVVDDLLDTLRRAGGTLGSAERKRLMRIKELAEWLDREPGVTMYTLGEAHWPPQSDGDGNAPKYVSLNGGSRLSSKVSATLGAEVSLFDARQRAFEFWTGTIQVGGASQGTAVYPGPWSALKLVWQDGVMPGDFAGGSAKPGQNWIVPVRSGVTGKQIWIGVSFSEPLPFDPKDWPSCNGGN